MDLMSLSWPMLITVFFVTLIYIMLSVFLQLRINHLGSTIVSNKPDVFSANPVETIRYIKFLFSKSKYDPATNMLIGITRLLFVMASVGVLTFFVLVILIFNGGGRL